MYLAKGSKVGSCDKPIDHREGVSTLRPFPSSPLRSRRTALAGRHNVDIAMLIEFPDRLQNFKRHAPMTIGT
jgi:hypothetical protein